MEPNRHGDALAAVHPRGSGRDSKVWIAAKCAAGLTTVTPEVRFVSSTLSDFEANDVVT
jgi:hypothetical protein